MDQGTALEEARLAMRLADVDPGRAVPAATRAAQRARRAADAVAVAVAEQAWGHSLLQCGKVDAAIRHLRRASVAGHQAGSAALTGEAQMKLAYALVQRGRPQSALHEVNAAVHTLDGHPRAKAIAQRAVIQYQIGRLDEALADYRTAVPVLRQSTDRLALQRVLLNRGILLTELHDFPAAETDLVEADKLARELGRYLVVGIIEENLGFAHILRGDVPAALTHLNRAEQAIIEHGGQLAPLQQDRSDLLLSVGLVAEAREAAERAIVAFRRERRQLKVPEVRLLLAHAAFLDGDWLAAAQHAGRAMHEFHRQRREEWAALARLAWVRARLSAGDGRGIRLPDVEQMARTLADNGWPAATVEARLVASALAGRHGRSADAHDHLQQASRVAHHRGPATLRARGWYAEALVRLDAGDRAGALAAARVGLRVLDEHGAALGAADLRVHSATHRRELTGLGLRIALDDGRPARVFEWAERGRASRLWHRPVRPPDDPELAHLLSELRATAMDVDRVRDDGSGSARQTQRQIRLERQIRDHIRLRRGERGGRLPGPMAPSPLGAALGESVLVEFVQLDGALHGLSLVDGRLRLRALGPVAPVADLVERLPHALHRLARPNAPAATVDAAMALLRGAAARLDTALLGPFAAELGDRPLVVVPTGMLHSVPWSILPSCAGRPVAVSPSATLWYGAHARAAPNGGAGGGTVVAAGPRLRGAREEALAVAAIHGATALVDDDATVDVVLAALAGADVAHLAAHGRLSADNPLFSDLLLADGPLVVYDVERLASVPHTVVLAACDSGRSVVRTGDELLGLSATFIGRGTAALVASVLPIPDAETAPLMVAFHRRLAGGAPPAVALAAAQLDLAGGSADPATLAAAAGFVCLGSGLDPAHGPATRPSRPGDPMPGVPAGRSACMIHAAIAGHGPEGVTMS